MELKLEAGRPSIMTTDEQGMIDQSPLQHYCTVQRVKMILCRDMKFKNLWLEGTCIL